MKSSSGQACDHGPGFMTLHMFGDKLYVELPDSRWGAMLPRHDHRGVVPTPQQGCRTAAPAIRPRGLHPQRFTMLGSCFRRAGRGQLRYGRAAQHRSGDRLVPREMQGAQRLSVFKATFSRTALRRCGRTIPTASPARGFLHDHQLLAGCSLLSGVEAADNVGAQPASFMTTRFGG